MVISSKKSSRGSATAAFRPADRRMKAELLGEASILYSSSVSATSELKYIELS